MNLPSQSSRREMLAAAGALPFTATATHAGAAQNPPRAARVYRIGVISASINGRAQRTNGHTWHFAQYFHPEVNMPAIRRHLDPGSVRMFERYLRSPRYTFDQLPFPDTRITHVYANPADGLTNYIEAFPGVRIARTLAELVENVDAVWLGDASGQGNDHFDLIAPALRRGLPVFCDKPIGGTVAQTRRILDLAREHRAPLMSSSLFRHEFGMEQALRIRDAGEAGPLQFVLASMAGGYSREGWFIYGQHPAWTVVTLCGPAVEAVSMYAREATAHALVTYRDRMPAEIWYGRPDIGSQYCHTSVHFTRQVYQFTPAIEGDFWYGHHYEMFRMAHAFREMIRTRREPVPHEEILAVTAIIHAGARSLANHGRLVPLTEVMPRQK
ncbi:MAG: Gfo/Idh/MocA family oxidoreductase [Planctomycetes bacterium]|nr:Gfo/Idh/MocA family oxidoreductase [Planctomycetota bacterium]